MWVGEAVREGKGGGRKKGAKFGEGGGGFYQGVTRGSRQLVLHMCVGVYIHMYKKESKTSSAYLSRLR